MLLTFPLFELSAGIPKESEGGKEGGERGKQRVFWPSTRTDQRPIEPGQERSSHKATSNEI